MAKRNPSAIRRTLGSVLLLAAVVAVLCWLNVSRTRTASQGRPTIGPASGHNTTQDRTNRFNDATDRFNGPAVVTEGERP